MQSRPFSLSGHHLGPTITKASEMLTMITIVGLRVRMKELDQMVMVSSKSTAHDSQKESGRKTVFGLVSKRNSRRGNGFLETRQVGADMKNVRGSQRPPGRLPTTSHCQTRSSEINLKNCGSPEFRTSVAKGTKHSMSSIYRACLLCNAEGDEQGGASKLIQGQDTRTHPHPRLYHLPVPAPAPARHLFHLNVDGLIDRHCLQLALAQQNGSLEKDRDSEHRIHPTPLQMVEVAPTDNDHEASLHL